MEGLVGFYRLVGKTGKTRLPLNDSLLLFLGSVLLSFCNFMKGLVGFYTHSIYSMNCVLVRLSAKHLV